MPSEAVIGFQSNGLLLNDQKCCNLLSAGLTTICLSLDSLDEEPASSDGEHNVRAVTRALAALVAAKQQTGNESFKTGLEVVLTRNNIYDLPRTWRGYQGAGTSSWHHPPGVAGGYLEEPPLSCVSPRSWQI